MRVSKFDRRICRFLLDGTQLSEYGRKEDALAIVSRLAEMTERVKMDGPDRRMAPCDAEGAGR